MFNLHGSLRAVADAIRPHKSRSYRQVAERRRGRLASRQQPRSTQTTAPYTVTHAQRQTDVQRVSIDAEDLPSDSRRGTGLLFLSCYENRIQKAPDREVEQQTADAAAERMSLSRVFIEMTPPSRGTKATETHTLTWRKLNPAAPSAF